MEQQASQAAALSGQPRPAGIPTGRNLILLNLLLAAVVLAKDLLLASYLGVNWQADAFFLAFFLPDAIGSSLLATALATAWVPEMVSRRGSPGLWRLVLTRRLLPTGLASLLLVAVMFWLRRPLLWLVAAGQTAAARELATNLFSLLLPLIALYPLTAVASALLQAHQSFTLPALGPLLQNGLLFLALLVIVGSRQPLDWGVYRLTTSLLLAAGCPLLVMLAGARQRVAREPLSGATRPPASGRDSQRLLPFLLIAASGQLLLLGERFWASQLAAGSVAALHYAYRLVQFPLWTFVSALAMLTLPQLAAASAQDDQAAASSLLAQTLRLALLCTLPVSLALSLLGRPIVSLLLQHGNFDPASAVSTARILESYALAIAPSAGVLLGQRYLLAKGEIMAAALVSLGCTGVTFWVDGYLIQSLGAAGLGYGAALGALINATAVLCLLKRSGLEMAAYLRSQAVNLLLAHLPLAAAAAVSAWLWPLASAQGAVGQIAWSLFAVCLLLASWLLGLTRTRLLPPLLAFLGFGAKKDH